MPEGPAFLVEGGEEAVQAEEVVAPNGPALVVGRLAFALDQLGREGGDVRA